MCGIIWRNIQIISIFLDISVVYSACNLVKHMSHGNRFMDTETNYNNYIKAHEIPYRAIIWLLPLPVSSIMMPNNFPSHVGVFRQTASRVYSHAPNL